MRVYVIRHGYAGDYIGRNQGANFIHNPADLNRVLMQDGIDAANSLAAWMADTGETPNVIFHSPVMRAKQTAKILGRQLGVKVSEFPTLQISKPFNMAVKYVAADPKMKRVALVAHIDNIVPGLRALNYLSGSDRFGVDPIAMAECRVMKVDRDTCTWDEKSRVMPSDLGGVNYY